MSIASDCKSGAKVKATSGTVGIGMWEALAALPPATLGAGAPVLAVQGNAPNASFVIFAFSPPYYMDVSSPEWNPFWAAHSTIVHLPALRCGCLGEFGSCLQLVTGLPATPSLSLSFDANVSIRVLRNCKSKGGRTKRRGHTRRREGNSRHCYAIGVGCCCI